MNARSQIWFSGCSEVDTRSELLSTRDSSCPCCDTGKYIFAPCGIILLIQTFWNTWTTTVLLLKSFHIGRSFFLLTGRHYSLCKLTYYFSMFKEFPIKIFLLKSQKWRQLRQSNLPPLFARRRSASYWAKSEMQPGYRKKYETSFERNPSAPFAQ